MTHKLTIALDQAEIHQAITDYALKNIDLGVPFTKEDVVIERISLYDAKFEIIPNREFHESCYISEPNPAYIIDPLGPDYGKSLDDLPF